MSNTNKSNILSLVTIVFVIISLALAVTYLPTTKAKYVTKSNYEFSLEILNPKPKYFAYTGAEQIFTAEHSGYYALQSKGANGGKGIKKNFIGTSTGAYGGKGGYISGIIFLNENDILYVYVGGLGESPISDTVVNNLGGYNGGGNGTGKNRAGGGGGGGGATDLRFIRNDVNSRVLIAGGGGGGGGYDYSVRGGDAGSTDAFNGKNGFGTSIGRGATTTTGGTGSSTNGNGSLHNGGNSFYGAGGAGGGAGFYGGGSSGTINGGGGGGSSYYSNDIIFKEPNGLPDISSGPNYNSQYGYAIVSYLGQSIPEI